MTSVAVPASLRRFLTPLPSPSELDLRMSFGLNAPLLLVGHPEDSERTAMNYAWENEVPILRLDLRFLAVPPSAAIPGSLEAVLRICDRQPCILYVTGLDEPRSMLVQRIVEDGIARIVEESRNVDVICAVEADVLPLDATIRFAGRRTV